MSESHNIERRGTDFLMEDLQRRGRVVTRSKRKTFDLLVDGVPAEVKCTRHPWAKYVLLSLTDNQRQAIDKEPFILFMVCNLDGPGAKEIKEIHSTEFIDVAWKVYASHEMSGGDLRAIVSDMENRVGQRRRAENDWQI